METHRESIDEGAKLNIGHRTHTPHLAAHALLLKRCRGRILQDEGYDQIRTLCIGDTTLELQAHATKLQFAHGKAACH